jgi:hypothetical protein
MRSVPTGAEVKQKLILEEGGTSAMIGKTSWIASGIKIQELQ